MRTDKVPCDGGCGAKVRASIDWLYIGDLKVFACDDCATKRFDKLYDTVSFDWWVPALQIHYERIKQDIIKRLGSLSPSAMNDVRRQVVAGGRRG